MLRKRDKRALIQEKQLQRARTPEEQQALDKLLVDIRRRREQVTRAN